MDEKSRRPGETLRASGVSRSFEGVHALRDVTLELRRGDIVGLIGPNGAGKSTLVNVLTGFDRPTVGTVELEGRDITGWSPSRRGRAGLTRTFQHSHAFRSLSVRENVEVAALGVGAGRREAQSRAARLLGVHPNTLRAWADRGLVPVTRLPSGYRRFTTEQLEQIRTQMLQLRLPETDAPKAAA